MLLGRFLTGDCRKRRVVASQTRNWCSSLASDSDILKGSEMTQEAYLGELQDGVQQHRGSGMMRKRAHYRIDDGNFIAGATNDRVVTVLRDWYAESFMEHSIGGMARTVWPKPW
jgi:hypothetical protein